MDSIVTITKKTSIENTTFFGNLKYEDVRSCITHMERCDTRIPNVGIKITLEEHITEKEIEIFINRFGFAGGHDFGNTFNVYAEACDGNVFGVRVEFDETLSTPIHTEISEWFEQGDFEDDKSCDVIYSVFHVEIVTD